MERRERWDRSGLKEASQRALKLGRTHQEFDIRLLLDMLLEIERHENEHATLVEQRDLLASALRNLIRQLPNDERLADYSLDEAEYALATVEQGGESR